MKIVMALVVGYVIGAKTGGKELDQLSQSVKALYDTEEFADVVTAARAQIGGALRELAGVFDGQHFAARSGGDVMARVRRLVEQD